eukprot:5140382-Alexandrium_andersonii.AAC.1
MRPRHAPQFSAEEMRADWQEIWAPEVMSEHAAAWTRWAALVPAFPQSAWEDLLPLDSEAFYSALAGSDGSAGLDGWTGAEMRHLARRNRELCDELFGLWMR